jgi:NAD(P)-dependent dehydrogenase (short-subunit alcohol dehydrogenase family)
MDKKPVVLITGANSGIGLALAQGLAGNGYKVYGTYRNPRKARELQRLSKGLAVFPIVMDVDKTPSVQKAVSQILKREGHIDVLLNNAGFVIAGAWEEFSDVDLREQFETNLFGILRVIRAVLPAMRRQGSGKILNMGSVSGFVATPFLGAYSATKFALSALTESMRIETRPWGVDVTEINPSVIQSSIVQNTRRAEKALSAKSPYTPFTRDFEKTVKESFNKAASVEKVVKVVLNALVHNPMKRRYLVKPADYAVYYLRRFLPDKVWEWSLTKMFPWSRRP